MCRAAQNTAVQAPVRRGRCQPQPSAPAHYVAVASAACNVHTSPRQAHSFMCVHSLCVTNSPCWPHLGVAGAAVHDQVERLELPKGQQHLLDLRAGRAAGGGQLRQGWEAGAPGWAGNAAAGSSSGGTAAATLANRQLLQLQQCCHSTMLPLPSRPAHPPIHPPTCSSLQSQGRPPMKSLWGESCTTVFTTSRPANCGGRMREGGGEEVGGCDMGKYRMDG